VTFSYRLDMTAPLWGPRRIMAIPFGTGKL